MYYNIKFLLRVCKEFYTFQKKNSCFKYIIMSFSKICNINKGKKDMSST